MADISAIISSSGGISPGTPFALLKVLAVQQVNPPVAFTQRLGFLLDPEESIVAPGVLSGAGSFVVGRGVVDSANGLFQVLVGDSITTNTGGGAGQADAQTILGSRIAIPVGAFNSQNLVVIGDRVAFNVASGHNSFGDSVIIGAQAQLTCLSTADADLSVVIGASAQGAGGQVVCIGNVALVTDNQGVAIGANATAAGQSIAIGDHTGSGVQSVAIGGAGTQGGTRTIVLGWRTNLAGSIDSIAIAVDLDLHLAPVTNWCQLGSPAHPINTIAWSNGHLDIVAGALTYTGGLGTVTVLAPA